MEYIAGMSKQEGMELFQIIYHVVFIGGAAALILSQIFGIARDSDEYAAAMKRQMRH